MASRKTVGVDFWGLTPVMLSRKFGETMIEAGVFEECEQIELPGYIMKSPDVTAQECMYWVKYKDLYLCLTSIIAVSSSTVSSGSVGAQHSNVPTPAIVKKESGKIWDNYKLKSTTYYTMYGTAVTTLHGFTPLSRIGAEIDNFEHIPPIGIRAIYGPDRASGIIGLWDISHNIEKTRLKKEESSDNNWYRFYDIIEDSSLFAIGGADNSMAVIILDGEYGNLIMSVTGPNSYNNKSEITEMFRFHFLTPKEQESQDDGEEKDYRYITYRLIDRKNAFEYYTHSITEWSNESRTIAVNEMLYVLPFTIPSLIIQNEELEDDKIEKVFDLGSEYDDRYEFHGYKLLFFLNIKHKIEPFSTICVDYVKYLMIGILNTTTVAKPDGAGHTKYEYYPVVLALEIGDQ